MQCGQLKRRTFNVTQTIPIVFVYVADQIGSGFAASLARPGRNITGFTSARALHRSRLRQTSIE